MKSVKEWAAHYFSVAFSHRHSFRTYSAAVNGRPGWSLMDGLYPTVSRAALGILRRFIPGLIVP